MAQPDLVFLNEQNKDKIAKIVNPMVLAQKEKELEEKRNKEITHATPNDEPPAA